MTHDEKPVTSNSPAKLEMGRESEENPLLLKAQSRKLESRARLSLPARCLLKGPLDASPRGLAGPALTAVVGAGSEPQLQPLGVPAAPPIKLQRQTHCHSDFDFVSDNREG